jgi:hypothetical protein
MMAASVTAETPMKEKSEILELLGLDDSRLTELAKEVDELHNKLRNSRNVTANSTFEQSLRNQKQKLLRAKVKALRALSTANLQFSLEMIIVDCE